jgi:hypothetical protein
MDSRIREKDKRCGFPHSREKQKAWIPAFARKTKDVDSRIREKDKRCGFPHSREKQKAWIPAFARKTKGVDSRIREKDKRRGFPGGHPIQSYQKLGTNYLVSILI